MHRRRITIVQPYIPPYRVPFFRRLAADLHGQLGAELTVAHGSPPPATGCDRDDGTLALEGAVVLSERSWQIGGLPVRVRRLGDLPTGRTFSSWDRLSRTWRPTPARQRIVAAGAGRMWACPGHVGPWSDLPQGGRPSAPGGQAGSHPAGVMVFRLHSGGADHVAAGGFPRDRITVVRNSTDTTALVAARNAVTDAQVAEFASQHGLVPDRTGLYLGGFHASKRIPFLLEAVAHIVKRMPDFRLLVAGDGACRSSVESSAARGDGVVYVGPVHDDRRALLGAASRLMLMPGLVGLCAVDSFALRTPLVTTDWPGHSPEFEYLEHGRNAMVASGGPEQYAEAVVRTLSSPELMARLQRGCVSNSGNYTVEEMSARFAAGVAELLERRPSLLPAADRDRHPGKESHSPAAYKGDVLHTSHTVGGTAAHRARKDPAERSRQLSRPPDQTTWHRKVLELGLDGCCGTSPRKALRTTPDRVSLSRSGVSKTSAARVKKIRAPRWAISWKNTVSSPPVLSKAERKRRPVRRTVDMQTSVFPDCANPSSGPSPASAPGGSVDLRPATEVHAEADGPRQAPRRHRRRSPQHW